MVYGVWAVWGGDLNLWICNFWPTIGLIATDDDEAWKMTSSVALMINKV